MIERYAYLDYIRAIAALLVVLLHTSAPYLYKIQNIELSSWLIGNLVDSFTRISVPLFFMISGFLFFRDKSPKPKNFLRVILALLFYSVISLLYLKHYREANVSELITGIFFKPVFYHLWFFYSIFVIYLLAIFIQVRATVTVHTVTLIAICFVALNPQLPNLTKFIDVSYSSKFNLDGNSIYFLLYAVFGAMLGNTDIVKNSLIKYFALSLYVISSLLIFWGTYIVSVEADKYVGTYYNYASPLVAIGAFSVFVLVKNNFKCLVFCEKLMCLISKHSLAIYGLHAVILDYIYRAGYRDFNKPFVDIPLVFAFAVVSSLALGVLIKRFDNRGLVT